MIYILHSEKLESFHLCLLLKAILCISYNSQLWQNKYF
ncbi:unnamed protein product [Paramecium sonneborni]|uniref:Uncharacterized protein n=1 Tax=Paramecium sonneborni TaxID=65129 RepID=A0A8S1M6S9_9CILI|nr:unnamed protein product [Paramecium sonneborni]